MSDVEWQKSTFSSGNPDSTCLELARSPAGGLRLRESEDPATTLTTSPTRLAALLRSLRAPVTNP